MSHAMRVCLFCGLWVVSACSNDENCDGLVVRTVSMLNRDYPMPGIRVQVDGGAWQTTDENGEACFEGAGDTYTATVYQAYVSPYSGKNHDDAWVLVDRSDNPLIVAVDTYDDAECPVTIDVSGRSREDSWFAVSDHESGGTVFPTDATFELMREHTPDALVQVFEVDHHSPVTEFLGFGSARVPITDKVSGAPCGGQGSVELQPVDNAHVTGTFSLPEELSGATVRAGATIDVEGLSWWFYQIQETVDQGSFDVAFPILDGASPSVSVSSWFPGSCLITLPVDDVLLCFGQPSAYEEQRVSLPSSDVSIELGAPVELLEPAADAAIDGETGAFRWTPAADADVYTLRLECAFVVDASAGGGDGVGAWINFFVEATTTEATVPIIPDLERPTGAELLCAWRVAWSQTTAEGYREVRSDARLVTVN